MENGDGLDFKRMRQMLTQALEIIDTRQAEPYVKRFIKAVVHGEPPEPMDRMVGLHAVFRALDTPEGRKAAGLPRRARGKAVRYDARAYEPDSEPIAVASRYQTGELSRTQAREQLWQLLGGDDRTLDALLDGLCERNSFFSRIAAPK